MNISWSQEKKLVRLAHVLPNEAYRDCQTPKQDMVRVVMGLICEEGVLNTSHKLSGKNQKKDQYPDKVMRNRDALGNTI